MDEYKLSQEGRWKFLRIREDTETARFEGYEILNYLYEQGAGTIEEISYHTELSTREVAENLSAFISRGLVEQVTYRRRLWSKDNEIQLPG